MLNVLKLKDDILHSIYWYLKFRLNLFEYLTLSSKSNQNRATFNPSIFALIAFTEVVTGTDIDRVGGIKQPPLQILEYNFFLQNFSACLLHKFFCLVLQLLFSFQIQIQIQIQFQIQFQFQTQTSNPDPDPDLKSRPQIQTSNPDQNPDLRSSC